MISNRDQIIKQTKELTCRVCKGSGVLIEVQPDGNSTSEKCRFCDGTGWKSGKHKMLIHNAKGV